MFRLRLLFMLLLFPLAVTMADDQIKCTSCSSCQNTCHQVPSPPPPTPSASINSCPPSPPSPPPGTSIYVYSSPPRGSGATGVYNPPPYPMNYPTPPPPNPIVPYFPFYFYSPPPPSTASTTRSSTKAFGLFTFLVMLLI